MNIRITQQKNARKALVFSTLKICIAGVLIGFFHQYDAMVAILLALYTARAFYKNLYRAKTKNSVLILGMILTGVLGIAAENWGVYNHFWEYHDLTGNRQLPYWLPFAWMLAFKFIYDLESKLIASLQIQSLSQKILIAVLVTAIFPAFGEVITINLGVWTYFWPYQIFGVPLYAFVCLVVLHMFVNSVLFIVAKKKNIHDVVFNLDGKKRVK